MDQIPNYDGDGAPELRVSTSAHLPRSNDSHRRNSASLFNSQDHLLFAWPKNFVYQDDLLRDHSRRLSTDSASSSNYSPVESPQETITEGDDAASAVRSINRLKHYEPYTEVFPRVMAGEDVDSGATTGMRARRSGARAAGLTEHLKRVARGSGHWEALDGLQGESK